MSGAFGIELPYVIVILGGMVTFVSLVGGAFGVAASDFVQMFLVVTVTLVISAFALVQPAVGGFSGLLQKVPASHFHWGEFARPEFITLWFLALMFNNIFAQNSMEMSAKYLMARSDAHARKMVLVSVGRHDCRAAAVDSAADGGGGGSSRTAWEIFSQR